MAVAVPAIVAGIGAFGAGIPALGLAAGSVGAFAVGAVSSFVLSGLSQKLAPKPPSGNAGSFASIRNQGITRQIRQPITERRVVYGEQRVSGPMALVTSTDDNKYLHLVIILASHEVQEIGEILINDVSITDDMLDGDNIINEGRYDGLVRIKKYLGSNSQTADIDLVTEVDEWTAAHRLKGMAYLYIRLKWDRDAFPGGIPNFSAWVKGKKILDGRDLANKWSANIALIARDYLSDNDFGLQVHDADINLTNLNAAANTCEEFVETQALNDTIESANSATRIITLVGVNDRLQYQTGDKVRLSGANLPGGLFTGVDYYIIVYQRKDNPRIKLASSLSDALEDTPVAISSDGTGTITKIAEPRYFGGVTVKTNAERGKNLEEILSGMAGQAVYAGGKWNILAGEYQIPQNEFCEDDLISQIKIQTKVSRRERFNSVTGVYISPINDGNPSDYPLIDNATYIANDNGEILRRNLDLPATQRAHTAMRIAKIDLERSRQEIVFSASFKLSAFALSVGDNFYLSIDKYGWAQKIFEVIDWGLSINDGNLAIEITARENAPQVYDWNNGEETRVDPAPNTNLPSAFEVKPPTSLSVTPIEIGTQKGDLTYEFEVAWSPPSDQFVINGGHYEVQFKRSSDDAWRRSYRAEDDDSSIRITQVQPGINYDVRVRAVNSLGVRSAYQSLYGFNVSSPSGATIALDYGFLSADVADMVNFGLMSEAANINDYGDLN